MKKLKVLVLVLLCASVASAQMVRPLTHQDKPESSNFTGHEDSGIPSVGEIMAANNTSVTPAEVMVLLDQIIKERDRTVLQRNFTCNRNPG